MSYIPSIYEVYKINYIISTIFENFHILLVFNLYMKLEITSTSSTLSRDFANLNISFPLLFCDKTVDLHVFLVHNSLSEKDTESKFIN